MFNYKSASKLYVTVPLRISNISVKKYRNNPIKILREVINNG